ncbi:hypothetical protein ACFWFX_18735 [Streptomyces roseolus]|uniref:hypothetical protein n=1 Tax=Streptomyces roseolus TaxID=67358 RepID=UPI00364FB823
MGDVSRRGAAPPVSVDPATLPELSVDDILHEEEPALIARGIAYGKEFKRIEGVGTTLLKNLATVAVAVRRQHDDPRGQSFKCREIMAEIYRAAGVDASAQGGVRYHIGNIVRQVFSDEELRAANLLPTSPQERQRDNREAAATLVKTARVLEAAAPEVFRAAPTGKAAKKTKSTTSTATTTQSTGSETKATADQLRLVAMASGIVNQINTDTIANHMTDGQRARLDAELEAMAKAITALRRRTRKPRSKA